MAGKIDDADVQKIRETVRIEDIVSNYVTLVRAGSSSMKGLCPFHDEKTPSFHISLGTSWWHCFGCGEGGDLIDFVRRIEGLSFPEAVEFLAARAGITLHYIEGGEYAKPRVEPGTRQRLLEANQVAQDFFTSQLLLPEAASAQAFLEAKAFNYDDAKEFGVGYAPDSWDALLRHLRSRGFTDQEIQTVGLAKAGQRGLYDLFRHRVTWPIRDITGAVLGFGARRLDDSDPKNPKYVNTPETPIYHKSQVLYGIDRARKGIGAKRQCVIVEGYTDVMAMHLSGVTTAVATCGTAFTEDHARNIRRLIGTASDSASSVRLPGGKPPRGGEVIFTFDGDAAGQNAALKAFRVDQGFASQSFVAVAKDGKDPCDLRVENGPGAVQDLVASRRPLFDFVLKTIISGFDLDNPAGRLSALRVTAPVVAEIRDMALRRYYVVQLAGWLGVNEREAWREVKDSVSRLRAQQKAQGYSRIEGAQGGNPGLHFPGPDGVPASPSAASPTDSLTLNHAPSLPREIDTDPVARAQRDVLIAALHFPQTLAQTGFDALDPQAFTQTALRLVFEVILASGGVAAFESILEAVAASRQPDSHNQRVAMMRWANQLKTQAGPLVLPALLELAQRPVPVADDSPQNPEAQAWAKASVAVVERLYLTAQTARLRSKLNRLDAADPNREDVFAQLLNLENTLRQMNQED